jgi:Flp pilus assembly CpaE family ATPase
MPKDSIVAVIVSPDRAVQRELETALGQGSMAETIWAVSDYPDLPELERLKNAQPGCVLFLDFSDSIRARRIAAELDRGYPFVSMIAVHNSPSKDDVIELMQMGVREVIGLPISRSEVAAAFVRAAKKLKSKDKASGSIYAFLPAKAGAGATMIALSTAAAVGRLSKQRTLLLDFDLRLGVTSFLLQLDGHHSVQDALNESRHLDQDLWNKLVCARDDLDILGSAPTELPSEPSADAYMAVLNCAQARYAVICVDLPGAMERHELETLGRAKEIFLVCTSDVMGLHMAKRKVLALQKLDLGEKISAIVNHAERRTMLPLADVEKLLQVPVRFTLPSDSKTVACAVQQGSVIQGKSPLAAQIEAIAMSIVGTAAASSSAGPVKRFIEFFSVSPERDSEFWKR